MRPDRRDRQDRLNGRDILDIPNGPIRAVIFDFDGTLTEMTLDIPATIEEMKKVGLKYADPAVVRNVNESLISETIYAIEAVCKNPEAFRREALNKLNEVELSVPAGKGLFPYARKALTQLREKGLALGILTRAGMDALNLVFPDAMEYIDAIATREVVRFVKPHPAHMEKMLEMLGVAARESVFVGDQTTDVRTGQMFDMTTVGVLAGKATRTELESAGADYIITDVSELPALLEALLSSSAIR